MRKTDAVSSRAELYAALTRFAPLAFVLAVVAVHVIVAARSVGPMYLFDEVGYLAGANVIAGEGGEWSLCGSSYAVGYSAALAPLWWLPISNLAVYQIAVVVSALIGAAVMWPSTLLARHLGASQWQALLIGALVTVVPARALLDNYVIAENPLTLVVVTASLYALRLSTHSNASRHVAFGVLVGLAAAFHARAYPLAVIATLWICVRMWRRASRWSHALGAIVPIAILGGTGYIGMKVIGAQLFPNDSRTDDLFAGTSIARLLEVVSGQLFTQVVSWSLLGILGALAVVRHMRSTWRIRRLDLLTDGFTYVAASVLAMGGATVLLLASSAEYGVRIDLPVFGRYLDPFLVPLVIIGLASYCARHQRRVTTIAAGTAVVAVLLFVAAVLPRVNPEGTWIPFAVPGLLPVLDPEAGDDRPYLLLACLAAIGSCAFMWAARRRPNIALWTAVAMMATVTLVTDASNVDPFEEGVRARSPLYGYVGGIENVDVTFAADQVGCTARNKLQLELAGRIDVVEVGGDYGRQLVIGPAPEWRYLEDAGYERVPFTMWNSAAVWVYTDALDDD